MTLTFPAPNRPLSENESRRMHWAERARRLEPWRVALGWEVKMARLKGASPLGRQLPPSIVTIELPFPREGRRDPSNYSPMTKALVDALVAMEVWPDDTPEWVTTTEPLLVVGVTVCTVTLTPRGADA